MSDAYDKLVPGEKIKGINARLYNETIDVVRAYRAGQGTQGEIGVGPRPVRILNSTDATLAQFSIVGIGDPITQLTDDEAEYLETLGFDSAAPASDGSFAILQDGLFPDTIGDAAMDGVTNCKVEFSDTSHKFAAPIDDDYDKLASQAAAGPARILSSEVPAATQLNGGINNSVTTIVVDTSDGWPGLDDEGEFVILIGSEEMLVTAIDDDMVTWTVERAYDGTSAASHADNASVAFFSGVIWCKIGFQGDGLAPTPIPDGSIETDSGTATGPDYGFTSSNDALILSATAHGVIFNFVGGSITTDGINGSGSTNYSLIGAPGSGITTAGNGVDTVEIDTNFRIALPGTAITAPTIGYAENAYAGGATYSRGDLVTDGGHVFASVQNSNTGHATSDASWWYDLGAAAVGNLLWLLPDAAPGTTAGLITNTTQTLAGTKTLNGTFSISTSEGSDYYLRFIGDVGADEGTFGLHSSPLIDFPRATVFLRADNGTTTGTLYLISAGGLGGTGVDNIGAVLTLSDDGAGSEKPAYAIESWDGFSTSHIGAWGADAIGNGFAGGIVTTIVSSATTAKTNLGLAIGTNVQAWDGDLDALAALAGTNTIYYRSAANTWTAVTIGSNLDFAAGTLNTAATMDFSGITWLKLPTGTSPTVDAAGKVAIDTDGDANITQGILRYHDGAQAMNVLATDATPTANDQVPSYDFAAKKITWKSPPDGIFFLIGRGGIVFSGSYATSHETEITGAGGIIFGGKAGVAFIYDQPGDYTITLTATTTLLVQCWGSGDDGADNAGAGGRGGDYAEFTGSFAAGTYDLHVTAGGDGRSGSADSASGSWFSDGDPDDFVYGENGGTGGGAGSVGDTTHAGGAGGTAGTTAGGGGGSSGGAAADGNAGANGSGSTPGAGGAAVTDGGAGGDGGANTANGADGTAPGGGGGGTGGVGGAGASGRVVVNFL